MAEEFRGRLLRHRLHALSCGSTLCPRRDRVGGIYANMAAIAVGAVNGSRRKGRGRAIEPMMEEARKRAEAGKREVPEPLPEGDTAP